MYTPEADGSHQDGAHSSAAPTTSAPVSATPSANPLLITPYGRKFEPLAALAADVISPELLRHSPPRTEVQVVADRIRRRLTAHIDALTKAGALDRELALEIQAKIDAETWMGRAHLQVVR